MTYRLFSFVELVKHGGAVVIVSGRRSAVCN